MPTVTIAITHEQQAALDELLGQLRQTPTGRVIGWNPVFARFVDDLVWMVDKADTPAAKNMARRLCDGDFMARRVSR